MSDEQVQPAQNASAPWWFGFIGFFIGLSLFGGGIDVMVRIDLPAFLGAPLVIGMMTFGLLIAIGSLGSLLSDADEPTGSEPHP